MESFINKIIQKKLSHIQLSKLINAQLSKIESAQDIVQFLCSYSRFNRTFAGCVLNLASQVHLNHNLFGDAISSKIASHILAAAEDEYFDKSHNERMTHREYSEDFIKGVFEFFGTQINLSVLKKSNQYFTIIDEKIQKGYKVNSILCDQDIFSAIGFHIASELSGAEEFVVIDDFLKKNFPDLVKFLEEKQRTTGRNSYFWIKTHTFVEEIHFKYAKFAAEESLNSYKGETSMKVIKTSLENGFDCFFYEATDFFARKH